jgi:antitoxin (DNA-binding transcriptional repressor) of toxin-antitoxin stability system
MKATTRTVSVREFREHMTKYLHEAQKNNVHFIVMRHSEPVAHLTPVKKGKKDRGLESLIADVAEARKDAKEGRVYSPEQVREILGL